MLKIGNKNAKEKLSFAISIIGLFILTLYTVIPNVLENGINSYAGLIIFYVKTSIIAIIVAFIIFILFQAYALSFHENSKTAKKITDYCSLLYETIFYSMYISFIVSIIGCGILSILNREENYILLTVVSILLIIKSYYTAYTASKYQRFKKFNLDNDSIIPVVIIIVAIAFSCHLFAIGQIKNAITISFLISAALFLYVEITYIIIYKLADRKRSTNESYFTLLVFISITVGMLFVGALFGVSLSEISIESENLYESDIQIIPIHIMVHGLNSNLEICLYNETNSFFDNEITNITYHLRETNKLEQNSIIQVAYVGDREYMAYINSTELCPGPYKLTCTSKHASKNISFYIIS